MDIPRKDAARRRWIHRLVGIGSVVVAIPLITLGLNRLRPAAPGVERSTVWLDTVQRGPMVRQVRGLGTLVPENILWIPAITDGRVERILLKAGAQVRADTILLVLSNPQLDLDALDADYQVKGSEAELADLRFRLESQRLTQQAELARIQAELQKARLQADRDAALASNGLIADISVKLSRTTAEELEKRVQVEQERLTIMRDSVEAQLAVQRARIEKLKALHQLKRSQVDALRVRSGAAGVLQQVPVEVGQRLAAGTILAKVAQPTKLKAELKIAETLAKDIAIGQAAIVDTRNGTIPGRVSRIDPAAREGTVAVDIRLEGALPQGARPDLSVDGVVELERLADVLFVGRPVFGQPNSTVSIFRLEKDGRHAQRLQVKLGRTSVNTIEIVEGLHLGDQVVLSDMSAWDAHDRVRLQ